MKLALRVEILQFFQRFDVEGLRIFELYFSKVLNPRVQKSILGSDSLFRIESQHFYNEILGCLANVGPLWIWEGKLSMFNTLKY